MRQRRWLELLLEYDFSIEYQSGKENVVADALSRKSTMSSITLLQTSIMGSVREALQEDPFFKQITSTLLIQPKSKKQLRLADRFQLVEGLLYFRDCLYIPQSKEIKLQILVEAHDIPIAAHPGYIKTYNNLRKSFWWKGLKRDVLSYVTRCLPIKESKQRE